MAPNEQCAVVRKKSQKSRMKKNYKKVKKGVPLMSLN